LGVATCECESYSDPDNWKIGFNSINRYKAPALLRAQNSLTPIIGKLANAKLTPTTSKLPIIGIIIIKRKFQNPIMMIVEAVFRRTEKIRIFPYT
jgi:hypothetical protein